jgi:glutathione S-transferase
MRFQGKPKAAREPWRVERGEKALDFLNSYLAERSWLVGEELSIADISLLAYTRVSHEGGFDISMRRHLRSWLLRCEARLGLEPAPR